MKPVKNQRGAVGVILAAIGLLALIAMLVYFTTFARKHPATTDLIVPSSSDLQSAQQGVHNAENTQNKYLQSVPQN